MRPCPNQLIQLLLRRAESLCSLSAPPEPVYFWVCGGRTPENHFGRRDKKLVQGLSMAFLADQRELRYTTCWLFGDSRFPCCVLSYFSLVIVVEHSRRWWLHIGGSKMLAPHFKDEIAGLQKWPFLAGFDLFCCSFCYCDLYLWENHV